MPRAFPLTLALVFCSGIALYHLLPAFTINLRSPMSIARSPPYTGWLNIATLHPNPESFQPSRAALTLVVLRNAPVETEGFTLALFSQPDEQQQQRQQGHIAVDSRGNIYILKLDDYDGIVSLADRVTRDLPRTGEFRNTWFVKHDRTSQPIDRILQPKPPALPEIPNADYTTEYWETSVQGFDKTHRRLRERVGGFEELPDVLWELAGVVLEARDVEGVGDPVVLQRVKELLGNVF